MIPEFSREVPIATGEYILNVMARNNATEVEEAVNYLANGDMEVFEAILIRWIEKQGYASSDLPSLIEMRKQKIQPQTRKV